MNNWPKEFVLPLCDKDLLGREAKQTNQYIVTTITPTAEIVQKIKSVSNSIMGECSHLKLKDLICASIGPFVFARNFDLFFSFLRDIEKLNVSIRGIAWDCTLQTLSKCVNVLSKHQQQRSVWEEEEAAAMRQVVKMSCFILVRILEFFEDKVKSAAAVSLALSVPTKKRKKNGVVNMASDEAEIDKEDWAVERERALQLLADMISCSNLNSLWINTTSSNSACVEDSLINLLIKAACVCLANSDMSVSKSTSDSNSRNSVARLCAKVISINPNQLPVLASKMIYLLRNNEKSLTCIVELSIALAETYQHPKFIFEVLREIGSCDPAEFCQDSESTKTLTTYLVQLSARLPHLFFKWFFFLMPHFQEESYSFRMALCSISGEVLQYAFQATAASTKQADHPHMNENTTNADAVQENQTEEEFTEQQKKSRDELFEELQLHVHDVHANVRARAMATLTHLLQTGLIPLNSAVELLQFVAPSVDDVASSVRRNCIQLLAHFIALYPYAFKYQRHDFENLLKEEKTTLQEIMKASNKQAQQVHLMTREEAEKKWEDMSEKVVKHLVRAVSEAAAANKKRRGGHRHQLGDEDEDEENDEKTEEEVNQSGEDDDEEDEKMETNAEEKLSMLLAEVRSNLENNKFKEAIVGIEQALRDHPTCPLFMAAASNPTLFENEDDGREDEDEDEGEGRRRGGKQCHSSISGKKRVVMLHDLMKAVYIAPFAKLSVSSNEAADKILSARNFRTRSQVASADNSGSSSSAREVAELLQRLPSMSAEQIEDLIRTQKNKILLIQKCVKIQKVFCKQVLPVCWNLLGSATSSDVTTAIEFLVICVEFGLNIGCGIQKLLSLLACPDAAIRAAVVSAFQRIYFGQSVRTQEVAQNLLGLAQEDSCGETYSDWLSLQSLVSEFVRLQHMNEKVINYLWEVVTLKHSQVHTQQHRLISLALLRMAAREKPAIITSNLNVLIKYTLTPSTQNDNDGSTVITGADSENQTQNNPKFNFFLANEALKAILVTCESEQYERLDDSLRISEGHDLVNCISSLLCTGMQQISNVGWIEFVGSAVRTIFALVKDPLAVMGGLLNQCHPETLVEKWTNDNEEAISTNQVEEEIGNKSDVNEEIIRRFLCLLGHVAQSTAAFLEMNVFNEVQFNKHKQEVEKEAKRASRRAAAASAGGEAGGEGLNSSRRGGMRRAAAATANARQSVTHSVASTTMSNTIGDSVLNNNVMNECGDMIKSVCDDSIVIGPGVLAKFVPFVKSCLLPVGAAAEKRRKTSELSSLNSHPSAALRASATITLAKFMLTSEVMCRENLQLLFTIMEKDPEAVIRSNVITLTADLLIRFPNAVSPWTPNIYARLQDKCDDVRLNCVIAVAQLVLKEQIKVKGQISEMAKCILDPNPKIASHAKRLFEELAKKNNTLYNVLADIISRLSGHSVDCHDDAEKQVIDDVEEELGLDAGNDMERGMQSDQSEDEGSDFEEQVDDSQRASAPGEKKDNQFNLIIGFIIKLLPREKLSELLVDKMCQRFKIVSSSARQCRNLGFVLSLLHYNDKAFHKLQEHLPTYAPVLRNNKALLRYFHVVLENCKKNCKPELKPTISDLEAAMESAFRGEDKEGEKENENNENLLQSQSPPQTSKKSSSTVSEEAPRASRASSRMIAAGSSKETPAATPMTRRGNTAETEKSIRTKTKGAESVSKAKSTRRRLAILDSSASSLEGNSTIEEESSQSDEDREVKKSNTRKKKDPKEMNDTNTSSSSSVLDSSTLRRSMRNMTLSPLVDSNRQPEGKRSRRK